MESAKAEETLIDGIIPGTLTIDQENAILKNTVGELKNELSKYQRMPFLVSTIVDIMSPDEVVIRLNGGDFYVLVAKELSGQLKIHDRVLIEQKSLVVVKKIGVSKHFDVSNYVIIEKPKMSWKTIGGLESQVEEMKEVLEMPLLHPDLFEKVGIDPPKGILLHGPPGTGKTLLAKAAAATTHATFIEIVGSELVQKFIGEGTKFVKSIFDLAREKAPSIIFIDEIDAIAARRIEVGTSGEREVQRTFMQLLAELDGFRPLGNVKVVGATNRLDILDPAVTRPGRLDRMLKVPLPNAKGREEIFKIHTAKMSLDSTVDLKALAEKTLKFSGADVKAACTEAGYFAIRSGNAKICMADFEKAIAKLAKPVKNSHLRMYGE